MNSDVDLSLLTGISDENSVKFYSIEMDIYNIINNFLEKDIHEEAFFIVDLGKINQTVCKVEKVFAKCNAFLRCKV